jgi:hypothetical protein
MRRLSWHLRGIGVALAVTAAALVGAGSALAVVVDLNPGQQGFSYGVAMPTGNTGSTGLAGDQPPLTALGNAGVPVVTTTSSCTDPLSTQDLVISPLGLCWHNGRVMHRNETFAVTWDPFRSYFGTTRSYVEQFLSNVAAGSGTLTSPYAVTSQYADSTNTTGRALNDSVYGGGCIDYGTVGGFTCQFGNTTGSGSGNPYPGVNQFGSCQATGVNQWAEQPGGGFGATGPTGLTPNKICLTDADIQGEINTLYQQIQTHVKAGYTPTIVVLTPPGVQVCLDASARLCSANGLPIKTGGAGQLGPAQQASFCSYHGVVNGIPYVVQPWVASWSINVGCDEPNSPAIPDNPDAQTLSNAAGARLVSPLSQSHIAAIVNPNLNGWFANSGLEINDNFGCQPLGLGLDGVTVGGTAYNLQREFNNAGLMETDPNALACTPNVNLDPKFVLPSSVNTNDTVEFDGSITVSSMIVPKSGYGWSFGDGTANAVGHSVSHRYQYGGAYNVTLTVVDRGGNTRSLSQQLVVSGPQKPSGTGIPSGSTGGLKASLQLLPQNLRGILRRGLAVMVRSNQAADGIASISIPVSAARHAHIGGRGPSVMVARGTVSGLVAGVATLHLHIDPRVAHKLSKLRHVTLTVRLVVLGAGHHSVAVDAAGHY